MVLRQGVRETRAADLGVDAVEIAYPAGEPPAVTAYKANRAGYGHWEIRRITYPGGTPDYHEHRDRQAQGDWMGGLPEGFATVANTDLPGLVVVERSARDPLGGMTGWRIMPAEAIDLTGEN